MTKSMLFVVLALLMLAACQENPVENKEGRRGVGAPSDRSIGASDINLSCTRSWANPVDGIWENPNNWSPVGVPDSTDSVCLSTPGVYDVTLSSSQSVYDMQVGSTNWSTVSLRLALPPGSELRVGVMGGGWGATVKSGSEIVLDGTNNLFAVESSMGLNNYGLITVSNSCACQSAGEIEVMDFRNYGTLHLAGAATLTADRSFSNEGTISVTAPFPVTIYGDYVSQDGGRIVGTTYLDMRGDFGSSFSWRGGTISANANDPTKAVMRVFGPWYVYLDTMAVSGRLDVIGDWSDSHLVGRINAGMYIRLVSLVDHEFAFLPDAGWSGPFINNGILELAEDPSFATGHAMTVTGTSLENNGQLKVTGGQVADFALDTVNNNGALLINGKLRLSGNGKVLRNKGSIVVANGRRLEMASGAEYHAAAGSTMTGPLLLTNGTLQGLGTVGDVTSVSGSIRPGSPIGTLTARSVAMDATTGLTIDVGGTTPGMYDQLAVTGSVTYGGTLTVATLAPFVGGACGQVIPIITDNSAGARGGFNKFVGLVQPALVNRWRTYNPTGLYDLVGYNPTLTNVFVNQSSLAVTEGGSAATYTLCLGPTAPNADVVVTAGARLGEVGVVPTPLTFRLASWQLPQTVTVTANNDATVDSLIIDTVTNVVSSTDPVYNGAPAGALPVTVTDNDGNGDVAISLGDVPPSIVVGQEFNTRYTVSNNGPTLSTGTTLTIPALPGLAYVSATNATCTSSSGRVTCQLAGLASGAQVTVTLNLRALTAGTHSHALTLAGQQPDANAANNSVVRQVTVN